MHKKIPCGTPAERMRSVRIQKGLTQEELADRLEVSRVMIVKWEGCREDRLEDPKLSTICRIAHALGVSPSWLAFGDVHR